MSIASGTLACVKENHSARIVGLLGARSTELNGQTGTVIAIDLATSRVIVKLDTGEQIKVRITLP